MTFGVGDIDAPLEVKVPPAVPLSAQWPDREQWRSYLIQFRQFLNTNDPPHVGTLLRQVPRYIDDAVLRDRVGQAHALWREAQGPGWPQFELDGEVLTGAEVATLYLNGGMFHSDPELTARWNALSPQYRDVYQYKLMFFVNDVRTAVVALRDVLREARAGGQLRREPLDLTTGSRQGVG